MRTYPFRKEHLLLFTITSLPIAIQAEEKQRPNIIVILTDDMGYSDLGCYGGVIKTPSLDKLANNGLRFTQFYNTGRSCPTRASLLTGLHPHQAGIGRMISPMGQIGYQGELNDNCATMGQVLSNAGYETFAIGKWHVANMESISEENNKNGTIDKSDYPLQRGFDHYYGPIASGNYFDPPFLMRDNEFISPANDPEYTPKKGEAYYTTNAFGENAIKYLKERDKQKPFFMYLAFVAAHWPLQAIEEDVKPYYGRFDKGWESIREEVLANMKKEGLVEPSRQLTHDKSIQDWDKVQNKEFEARCMEVYAAMVSCMDKNVGRVVNYLEESGELDNTLILYLQDNGGCAELAGKHKVDKPMVEDPKGRAYAPVSKEFVQLEKRPYQTREGKPVRYGYGVMPGGGDTHLGYGRVWANVSNTPLREYKHFIHEGGISTPLIVHWSKGIKAKGELRTQPGQLMDIMATIVDVSGAEYPKTINGHKILPCEGKSLVRSFDTAEPIYPERELFWEHEGNRGVRIGDWKAVYKHKRGMPYDADISKWELYDISKDRNEQHNMAKSKPEILERLYNAWQNYAVRCRVKPWPQKD